MQNFSLTELNIDIKISSTIGWTIFDTWTLLKSPFQLIFFVQIAQILSFIFPSNSQIQ